MHVLITTSRWFCCTPLLGNEHVISTGLLVGVLSSLPSTRYVAWWGHSMASGTLGHFLSEEQQWSDLCKSFLSTTRVRSCFPDPTHVLVFSSSPVRYTNMALKLWKYSRRTMEENMSLILYRLVTCDKRSAMCRLFLNHNRSIGLGTDSHLPHSELTTRPAAHRWMMTCMERLGACCRCHLSICCGCESLDHVIQHQSAPSSNR